MPPPVAARGRRGLVVGALLAVGVVGLAGWALRPRLQRATRDAPPSAARAKLGEAHGALERDDPLSLERAVALADEARMLAPGFGEFVAWRALCSALVATSLRDEGDDLADELKWLEQRLSLVRAAKPADQDVVLASLEQRVGDARARLPVVEERAAKFAAEARRLAAEAAADGAADALAVARAQAAVLLLAGDVAQLDAVVAALDDLQRTDAWLTLLRGSVRTRQASPAADARTFLESALAARPTLLRARVALGRRALAETPPDIVAATDAFESVLRVNPTHDAARRGLSRIADLSQPPPAPDAAAVLEP